VRARLERLFGHPVIEHETVTGVAAGLAIVPQRGYAQQAAPATC
jgi:hypothetical protein